VPAFPDTTLHEDELDEEFGGQAANAFGTPSWQWINAVVRFLSEAHLGYNRAPYRTVAALSQTDAAAGDVAVFAPSEFATGDGYYVSTYDAGLSAHRWFGVYLDAVSAGGTARVAVAGLVPATVTNFSPTGAAADVGVDPATGRLREAQAGDTIVGEADAQGTVRLEPPGAPL
jgi:hypothetical protein